MNKYTVSTLTAHSLMSLTNDELNSSFEEILKYLEVGGDEEKIASEVIAQRIDAVCIKVDNAIRSQVQSIDLKVKVLRCYFKASDENRRKWYEYFAYLLYQLAYTPNTPIKLANVAKSILSDLQSYYSAPTIENAEIIIPNHKSDFEKAILIDMASLDVIEAVKCELFEWIADSNWPIAQCIIYIFANRFNELKELYAEYLDKGVDKDYDIGISSSLLLSFFYCKNRIKWQFLKSNLRRIVSYPSKDEHSEELDKYAKEILDYLKAIVNNHDQKYDVQ